MKLIVRELLKRGLIVRGLFEVWFLVLLQLNQVCTKKYDRQSGCFRTVWEKALSA